MRPVFFLAVLAALASPPAIADTRLGPGLSLAHGSFTTGDGMTVATELRRTSEGGTALCGVWAESESGSVYTVGHAQRILSNANVYVQGQRVATGLGFLPEITPQLDYAGAAARCIALDLPWRAGRIPEVFLPREVISPGSHDDGGHSVHFRQKGPGALGRSLEPGPFLRRQSRLVRLSPVAMSAGGRYSRGGGLRVAAEMLPVNGRAHLCGAWSELPGQVPQTEGVSRTLLHGAEVTLGGRKLDVDVGELRRVRTRQNYTGTHANCLDTGLDWRPAMSNETLRLKLPEQVVYRNTTPAGAQIIRFVPSSG